MKASNKRKMPTGLGASRKRISLDNKENIPPGTNVSNPDTSTTSTDLDTLVAEVFNPPSPPPDTEDHQDGKRLLLEYRYPLNKSLSKWVSVGIDPRQKFQVVVRIGNLRSLDGIQFNASDWNEFLQCRSMITNYLYGKNNVEYQSLRVHKLYYHAINDVKVLSIELGKREICLASQSLTKLFDLALIIDNYLNMLNSINFEWFYNDIMAKAVMLCDDINDNIQHLLNADNHLWYLAMNEMLILYPEIIGQYAMPYFK